MQTRSEGQRTTTACHTFVIPHDFVGAIMGENVQQKRKVEGELTAGLCLLERTSYTRRWRQVYVGASVFRGFELQQRPAVLMPSLPSSSSPQAMAASAHHGYNSRRKVFTSSFQLLLPERSLAVIGSGFKSFRKPLACVNSIWALWWGARKCSGVEGIWTAF